MNKLLSALQYLSRVRVQDMKYQNNDVIPEYFLIKVTLGYKGRLGSRGWLIAGERWFIHNTTTYFAENSPDQQPRTRCPALAPDKRWKRRSTKTSQSRRALSHPCPQGRYTQSFLNKLVVSYKSCMRPSPTLICGLAYLSTDFFPI